MCNATKVSALMQVLAILHSAYDHVGRQGRNCPREEKALWAAVRDEINLDIARTERKIAALVPSEFFESIHSMREV